MFPFLSPTVCSKEKTVWMPKSNQLFY
jgi:hypothetical protein